jgi:glycosyltransferase involved in cell wall biosynthesis
MRVLIITNNPNRASFRQRIGVYLDTFAAQSIAAEVALLPKGFLARRRLFRRAAEFDGVFLHKKKLNRCDAWGLRHHSRKIIYNFDDAIMYSDARPGRYSRAHAVPFRRTAQLADMVITGSAYLAEQARPFNTNIHVLPLGLNMQDYGLQALPPVDGRTRLVWIGSQTTLDYLDRIRPVLSRVTAAHDNVVVRIVGDTFPAWQDIPTEEIKWSPEARRVKLATSDIGLAPLPDDPFTQGKCSFKVLEYAASGLPVVASPVGTNTDYVLEGVTGFLAVTEDEWVARLNRLIDDPALRAQMGRRGRRHAAEHDVSVIGKRFVDLVRRCLEGRP